MVAAAWGSAAPLVWVLVLMGRRVTPGAGRAVWRPGGVTAGRASCLLTRRCRVRPTLCHMAGRMRRGRWPNWVASARLGARETVQNLGGEQSPQVVAPLIFSLSLCAAQSASRITARQTPQVLDGLLTDKRTDRLQSVYRKGIQPGNLSHCYTYGTEFSLRPESSNSLYSFKIMAIERCASRLCVPEGRFVRSGLDTGWGHW